MQQSTFRLRIKFQLQNGLVPPLHPLQILASKLNIPAWSTCIMVTLLYYRFSKMVGRIRLAATHLVCPPKRSLRKKHKDGPLSRFWTPPRKIKTDYYLPNWQCLPYFKCKLPSSPDSVLLSSQVPMCWWEQASSAACLSISADGCIFPHLENS